MLIKLVLYTGLNGRIQDPGPSLNLALAVVVAGLVRVHRGLPPSARQRPL